MKIIHPATDQPIIDETTGQPVTITLIGADSDEYKKLAHKLANEKLKKAQRTGKLPMMTAEALEAEALDLLVKSTKGWDGVCLGTEDGAPKPLPFNEENARKLYTEYPIIREQVATFVNDRGNFLGNS